MKKRAKCILRFVLMMLANLQVWYDVALLVHATKPFPEEHSFIMGYLRGGPLCALDTFAGWACQGWRKPCVTLLKLCKDLGVLDQLGI